ncbi:hypothetical protein ACM66B_006677 [Microbotryomycetes sp. NB124-2]
MLASELERLHALDDKYAPSFDDRLLIQIMMCLASGDRNLIVRVGTDYERLTAQERAAWVKRVSAEVAWLCTTIFAMTVNRVQCSSNMSNSAFQRSLFLPGPPNVRHQASMPLSRKEVAKHMSPVEQLKAYAGVDTGHPRSASSPVATSMPDPPEDPHDELMSLRSYPSAEPLLGKTIAQDPAPYRHDQGFSQPLAPPAAASSDTARLPGARRHTVNALGPGSKTSLPPILGQHSSLNQAATPRSVSFEGQALSSPIPRSTSFNMLRAAGTSSLLQPLSSSPSSEAVRRRASTSSVLAHGPGMTVRSHRPPQPLVSPGLSNKSSWLSRQRSIESTVDQHDPPPSKTLPQVLILERLDKAKPNVQQSLLNILRERRIIISGSGSSGTSAQAPRRPSYTPTLDEGVSVRMRRSSISTAQADQWQGSYSLPPGFLCVAIVCARDTDGGRWGNTSDYLLDRFTLSHSISPSSITSPSAFTAPPLAPNYSHPLASPTDTSRQALLCLSALPESALPRFSSPALETYTSDLLSTLRHHPKLESRMLTARARIELERATRVWVALSRGQVFDGVKTDDKKKSKMDKRADDEDLLVTPRDVVSVVLSVLGPRISLRDPNKEKSLFWGSDVEAIKQKAVKSPGGVEEIVRSVVAVV